MHYSLTATALLAFAAHSLAGSAVSSNKSFNVKQIAVPRDGKSQRGAVVLQRSKMYTKYGKQAHPNDLAAAKRVQSGSAATIPIAHDQSYLVPVTVGNKTLNLIVDTGSSDLWVFSTLLPDAQSSGHKLYEPQTDKKLDGYSFAVNYAGAGSASGDVYADRVVIGGVTATTQAVEAATSVSSNLVASKRVDGFLGLAFRELSSVSPKKQDTFFETISPTLKQKLFTANLKHNAPGEFTFGYIDESAYTGSIAYTAVNSTKQGNWLFDAGDYSIGAGNLSTKKVGPSSADTDGEFLFLPESVVKAYWAKVPSATYLASEGGYIVPCNATLPDFNVDLGGTIFAVYGAYLNSVPFNSSDCLGGIQSKGNFPFSLFGGVFFEAVYTVFDQTQSSPRLGFAQKAEQ